MCDMHEHFTHLSHKAMLDLVPLSHLLKQQPLRAITTNDEVQMWVLLGHDPHNRGHKVYPFAVHKPADDDHVNAALGVRTQAVKIAQRDACARTLEKHALAGCIQH